MSKAGDKPARGGRAMTADEARLWRHATHGLEPVKAKPRVGAPREDLAPSPPRPAQPAPPPAREAPPALPKAKPAAVARPKSRPPPVPLAEFERRKARQIAAGKIEVDASIDLHGHTQREAREELRAFLRRAHAQGKRMVLVVTGKGGSEEAADGFGNMLGQRQRGVLRRSVPHWLEEADLRPVVMSYTAAGLRHGGAGALYVQLRKAQSSGRGG
jgi:DNA-nicking Smr family endonuclease